MKIYLFINGISVHTYRNVDPNSIDVTSIYIKFRDSDTGRIHMYNWRYIVRIEE